MHIHILGICGTFMASVALLAKQLGHTVTGSDPSPKPPISDTLLNNSIMLIAQYNIEQLEPRPDLILIGNALRRGLPIIEHILNHSLPFTSAPQWLYDNVLRGRHVVAVTGTHGKTTTTTMISSVLQQAGIDPGYLIGGVPKTLTSTATLGSSSAPFIIEADEYDTAFFDKRPKMLLYQPRTVVITNLEMDHADIYDDLKSIEVQFHRLIRAMPGNGNIVHIGDDDAIERVIARGCWTRRQTFNSTTGYWAELLRADASNFKIYHGSTYLGTIEWPLIGQHNMQNALAAIATAQLLGVRPELAIELLCKFQAPVKRFEKIGELGHFEAYRDFAHHPTAIKANLKAARAKFGEEAFIVAALDLSSNSAKLGLHKETLAESVNEADAAIFLESESATWDFQRVLLNCKTHCDAARDLHHLTELSVAAIRTSSKQRTYLITFSASVLDNVAGDVLRSLHQQHQTDEL